MENATEEEFRVLPLEYTNKKISYKQVRRTDKVAMYVSADGIFEVIRVIIREKALAKFGGVVERMVPRREHLPSDENFGIMAWACQTEGAANAIYDSINNEVAEEKELAGVLADDTEVTDDANSDWPDVEESVHKNVEDDDIDLSGFEIEGL
jgi:hypothetical protein